MLLAKSPSADRVGAPRRLGDARRATTAADRLASADAARHENRRQVLGSRKNPFRPGRQGQGGQAGRRRSTAADARRRVQVRPRGGATAGGTPAGGATTPSTPATARSSAPTPAPEQTYELYSLKVRFGDVHRGGARRARTLKRLNGLPAAPTPGPDLPGPAQGPQDRGVPGRRRRRGAGRRQAACPGPTNCQTLQHEARRHRLHRHARRTATPPVPARPGQGPHVRDDRRQGRAPLATRPRPGAAAPPCGRGSAATLRPALRRRQRHAASSRSPSSPPTDPEHGHGRGADAPPGRGVHRLRPVSLRVVTAGESHGPGLTCVVEGLPGRPRARPRGDQPRHGPPPARPRPRRAHEDREGRRRGHRRRPPRPHARRPGRR